MKTMKIALFIVIVMAICLLPQYNADKTKSRWDERSNLVEQWRAPTGPTCISHIILRTYDHSVLGGGGYGLALGVVVIKKKHCNT